MTGISIEMDALKHRPDTSLVDNMNESRKNQSVEAARHEVIRNRGTDLVLTYKKQTAKQHEHQRRYFEQNMKLEGFALEYKEASEHGEDFCFILIQVPDRVLLKYADAWAVKMPVRLEEEFLPKENKHKNINCFRLAWQNFLTSVLFTDQWHYSDKKKYFLWPYRSDYHNWYRLSSNSCCLNEAQRQALIWNIIQSVPNDPKDSKRKGIDLLLEMKAYDNVYPVHEDGYKIVQEETRSQFSQGQYLRKKWATYWCTFRKQPLNAICRYFGHKVGFYFAFMGFYTRMLIPAAMVGLFTTLYGLLNMHNENVAAEICDASTSPGNFIMCPLCKPPNCEIWRLAEEGCSRTKTSYIMDNESTLFMSCFVIAWEALFLKLWRRREASLAFEWGTNEMEDSVELIRPDYIARAKEKRLDKVTMQLEDYIPWKNRICYIFISIIVTIFLLLVSSAALVVLSLLRVLLYGMYRKIGGAIFEHHSIELSRWTVHGFIFIVVFLSEKIYHRVCHHLTKMERPKTEKNYWFSFLWKLFVFALLNEFTPIFYVAFFKRVSIDTPLDLGRFSELCDPGGCTSEVTELIAVLLIGRLIVANVLGIGVEWTRQAVTRLCVKYSKKKDLMAIRPQWHSDFSLEKLEYDGVAEELMEMIVQFAFCTLFVAAFPLAPLVCLINNVIELRKDAKKMMKHRRPIPIRVCGIEIWNTFLDWIIYISVMTNAAFISFTSDLFPKIYYKHKYSSDHTFRGFTKFSISSVMTEAWTPWSDVFGNVTQCWYKGYRNSKPPYEVESRYWEILTVRMCGFTLFVFIFYTSTYLIEKIINNKPAWLKTRELRTKYLARNVFNSKQC